MKRTLFVAMVCLAVCSGAFAAAAKIYPSSAQALAPAKGEIGFKTFVSFEKAKKPTGSAGQGFKNGVAGVYEKGTTAKPTQVVVTILVYTSAKDAKQAWTVACPKCKVEPAPAGLKLKAEAGTSNKLFALHTVSLCSNVYLNIFEASAGTVPQMDTDIVKITNAVLTRATARGLPSCNAT